MSICHFLSISICQPVSSAVYCYIILSLYKSVSQSVSLSEIKLFIRSFCLSVSSIIYEPSSSSDHQIFCPSACQPISKSAFQPINLPVCKCIFLSVFLSVSLPVCQSVSLKVSQSVSLLVCQSASLLDCYSVNQSISLSVCYSDIYQPISKTASQSVFQPINLSVLHYVLMHIYKSLILLICPMCVLLSFNIFVQS